MKHTKCAWNLVIATRNDWFKTTMQMKCWDMWYNSTPNTPLSSFASVKRIGKCGNSWNWKRIQNKLHQLAAFIWIFAVVNKVKQCKKYRYIYVFNGLGCSNLQNLFIEYGICSIHLIAMYTVLLCVQSNICCLLTSRKRYVRLPFNTIHRLAVC